MKVSMRQYISDKAKKLIVPYFWMSFMMYPLWYITFHKISVTKTTILNAFVGILYGNNLVSYSSPSNALWFLLALFLAYVLYAAIVKIAKENKWVQFILIVICALIGYFDRGVGRIWHCNVAFTAVVFLYVGKCFMKLYQKYTNFFTDLKIVSKYIIMMILVIGGTISCKLNGRISMTANKFGNSLFLFYITAISLSVFGIMIVVMLPIIKIISYIVKNTLLYVGIHVPVIRFFEKLFPNVFSGGASCLLLAVCVYFGLAVVCKCFNEIFPYVCAKPVRRNDKIQIVSEILLVVVCSIIPMLGILQKFEVLENNISGNIILVLISLIFSIIWVIVIRQIK